MHGGWTVRESEEGGTIRSSEERKESDKSLKNGKHKNYS
jgi:hypothetical protein